MEQLGLVLLIALFLLVRFIVRSSRARETPVPQPPSRRGPPVPDDEEVVVRVPRPVSVAGPSSVVRAQPPARLAGRQPRWRTVLGTPQELRRAIVLREVLGPCRAIAMDCEPGGTAQRTERRGREAPANARSLVPRGRITS